MEASSYGSDDALYADDPVDGYSAAMLQRFDTIGFDPRGIGRSSAAGCDETILDSIPARPRNAAEFERLRTLNGRLAAACLSGHTARTRPGRTDTDQGRRRQHDLAAPLPGVQRMVSSFPKVSLFAMDVVGHWLYRRGGTEKAMQVIDSYLINPKSTLQTQEH